MILDYFRLAFESIRRRKLRSYLTMIGIFLGIAAVVSLISLAQGMQAAIATQFASFGTESIIIQAGGVGGYGPPGSGTEVKLGDKDIDVIRRVNGVNEVASRLIRSVRVESDDESMFIFTATVPDNKEGLDLVFELNGYEIEEGRFLKPGDNNKIVIGDDFATRNKFTKNLKVRDKISIEGTPFEIVGKLKRKGNPQQDSTMLTTEKSLKSALGVDDEVDIVVARVSKGLEPSKVADDVEKAMRNDRNLEEAKEDFSVETAEQTIGNVNNILAVVQGVLIGIAAISLLVGGIGIMNTMYTSVLERTREIGIMKAVGARRKDIALLFLIESGMLGLAGGLIGIILGLSLSKLVEIVATAQLGTGLLQANISLGLIFGALLFSFVLGSLSGITPAIQASKLKPVEALRK
jgi:putative ABC transport system permease protein